MFNRANITGLYKAAEDMLKSGSYKYRYNNDPGAEYGYHMGTQAGDQGLAIWNYIQDAMRSGMSYDDAIKELNIGMGAYNGHKSTGPVTGDDMGVLVRIPTMGGDSYQDVDLNEDVRQYLKNLYFKNLMQLSKNNTPKYINGSMPGFMQPIAQNAYMRQEKKKNKGLAQEYYDKKLAGKPMTRYTLTGPQGRYAQTARTYKGGKMGMTVDPVKTLANMKRLLQEGPQGKISRAPSGTQMYTDSAGNKWIQSGSGLRPYSPHELN